MKPIALLIAPVFLGAALLAGQPSQTEGQRLFNERCVSCHGDVARAPSFASGAFARGAQDREIAENIRNGIPGTQMPAFPILSADQISQLVAHIRSLARNAPAASPASVAGSAGAAGTPTGGVTYDRLRNAGAEPHNWLTYWGDYQGTHYSALTEITAANVPRLQAQWALQLTGGSTLQATPLVVDGVMYTSGAPGTVVAVDAISGRQIWRHQRAQKVRNPNEINPFNRGVAILGNRVFYGTLDAALVALDIRTGQPVWEVQVADTMLGYNITSAPLIVKDKIVVGVAGGEFGARGFLDAYDAVSGTRVWRWQAVPGPGEFGHDTWAGDSWKLGGSPTWLTGSFDPDLNLVYWTVGNPGPQIDRSVRAGDNLFSDSVVALDADTGVRKWHYQFTPNDGHDWDSCQDVILVDREWRGQRRKLLLHADRNGFFYVLDRTNGAFLSATPFVYQNWNRGFDAKGRPIEVPGSNSSPEGSFLVYPTLVGATNFQAPSYSPITGWMYLAYAEGGQRYISTPATYERGAEYIGRAPRTAGDTALPPGAPAPSAGIKALDPDTGKAVWDVKLARGSHTNGVLATAGGVVFAATREGYLIALDAKSGAQLWRFQTGATMSASPMSYAVGGKQFVAVSAGHVVYSFALPEPVAAVAPYAVRRDGEVVRLEDTAHETTVAIVPSVGNNAVEMKVKGQNVLRWPYASVEEFKARPTLSGIPLLAPWANRLDEQAFYANGRRHAFDMTLGNVRGATPIHGFLATTSQWQVMDASADASSAWVTSRLEFSRTPEWMTQFPFAHTIEMTHRLRGGALEVSTRIHNTSPESMPVAIGFHPYFQLTDSPRDQWTVSVGARTEWMLAANKIPTGVTRPIEQLFPDPKMAALKDYDLDHVFADLIRDEAGRATMTVIGTRQRLDVVMGPNYRAVVIYAPKSNPTFICFEPMTAVTNALNLAHRGVYRELQTIPSGQTWRESFWVRPSGF